MAPASCFSGKVTARQGRKPEIPMLQPKRRSASKAARRYRVLQCADSLEGADGHVDHGQRVIWIAPHVQPSFKPNVVEAGFARAEAEILERKSRANAKRLIFRIGPWR